MHDAQSHQIDAFVVSENEWKTKKGTVKFIKNAYVGRHESIILYSKFYFLEILFYLPTMLKIIPEFTYYARNSS